MSTFHVEKALLFRVLGVGYRGYGLGVGFRVLGFGLEVLGF